MLSTVVVTGGAGFIGSAVVRFLLNRTEAVVVNIDKLTYAGNIDSIAGAMGHPRHHFVRVDICNGPALRKVFAEYQPDAVIHLAAETHVDRSIDGPSAFIQTNILGTYSLLQVVREFSNDNKRIRFHHVSTDEVFGSLDKTSPAFVETTPYAPSSPYAASKASSDHLVRAWHRTYGMDVVISNCSNNYGPFQFPEKLIPLTILNALEGMPLPVYGKGDQVRDWLYVDDHAECLCTVLTDGRTGETYNIGGCNQRRNIDVVESICRLLDEMAPHGGGRPHRELIRHVADRPGHDTRYAIDAGKVQRELGWVPRETFETGLRKTVQWYLGNIRWWMPLRNDTTRGRMGISI